ncbi:hypothetical protein ACVWW1_003501 [Bradyrhizobium sp. JR3.5]
MACFQLLPSQRESTGVAHRITTLKCQFGDVGKDLGRTRKEKHINLSLSTHCWIYLATQKGLYKNEYGISSSIWLKSRRNRFAAEKRWHLIIAH